MVVIVVSVHRLRPDNFRSKQFCKDQLMLLKEDDRFNHFVIHKCSEINGSLITMLEFTKF